MEIIIVLMGLVIMWIIHAKIQLRKLYSWRKNLKVGDEGYFINLLSGKTYFKVKDINKNDAFIVTESWSSTSQQWMDKNNLYPKN